MDIYAVKTITVKLKGQINAKDGWYLGLKDRYRTSICRSYSSRGRSKISGGRSYMPRSRRYI